MRGVIKFNSTLAFVLSGIIWFYILITLSRHWEFACSIVGRGGWWNPIPDSWFGFSPYHPNLSFPGRDLASYVFICSFYVSFLSFFVLVLMFSYVLYRLKVAKDIKALHCSSPDYSKLLYALKTATMSSFIFYSSRIYDERCKYKSVIWINKESLLIKVTLTRTTARYVLLKYAIIRVILEKDWKITDFSYPNRRRIQWLSLRA